MNPINPITNPITWLLTKAPGAIFVIVIVLLVLLNIYLGPTY